MSYRTPALKQDSRTAMHPPLPLLTIPNSSHPSFTQLWVLEDFLVVSAKTSSPVSLHPFSFIFFPVHLSEKTLG